MSEVGLIAYAGCAFPVEGLGPGRRITAWVSGCSRRCPGCMSPELQARGAPVPVTQVADELARWLPEADGLTISGGEPFEQPAAVADLVRRLRELREIEVLAYTGFTLEELPGLGPAAQDLLAQLDMLIDGPYREDLPGTLLWRGSDNQRLHLLTERAQRYREFMDQPWPAARPLHLQDLGANGLRIIGIPRRADHVKMQAILRAHGCLVQAPGAGSPEDD